MKLTKKREMNDMKSTGIVRKIDKLGRVVIPSELRSVLKVKEGTALEIYVDDEKIIFQKYEPRLEKANSIKELREMKPLVNKYGKSVLEKAIELLNH